MRLREYEEADLTSFLRAMMAVIAFQQLNNHRSLVPAIPYLGVLPSTLENIPGNAITPLIKHHPHQLLLNPSFRTRARAFATPNQTLNPKHCTHNNTRH